MAEFDLDLFLPYLLNQAAEAASAGFQAIYREGHGMTRTQWRVMANLGKFGSLTARDICAIAHVEKTKVSRAVLALERAGMLARSQSDTDRRVEILSLTAGGKAVFADLGQKAVDYDAGLRAGLGVAQAAELDALLGRVMALVPYRPTTNSTA